MSHEELEEIKLCPFCGGEAWTRTTRQMNSDGKRFYVECKTCYGSSNPWYDMGAKETKAEAIITWNTRKSTFYESLPRGLALVHKITAADKCIEEQYKKICDLSSELLDLTKNRDKIWGALKAQTKTLKGVYAELLDLKRANEIEVADDGEE